MRKYVKPTIDVVSVETETIMAGSGFDDSLGNGETLDNPTDMLSKEHSFDIWSDDEE